MIAESAPVRRVASPAKPSQWWQEPFSVFQTNLQEIDATLDVEATLDAIEQFGANTWLINTGGIVSFYPTDLPFQTRNPFLSDRPSGDLIGDAVAAAHRRGIKVISRCDFSKVSARIAGEHPEWLYVSPAGTPQIYNTLYSACPSGAYYQKQLLAVVDEILERYGVDGFFFNWFKFPEADYSRVYYGVCHCESCKSGFDAFAGGLALPDGPGHPSYPIWLKFSKAVIESLSERIDAHITDRRPETALVLKRGAQVIYYEANNAFGRDLWHHSTSEAVSAHVTGLPEIALLVNCVSFVDMPYRMAAEQPEHFAQYLLQAIARGGNPSTYIMGDIGRIPYPSVPRASEITNFHRRNRAMYSDLKPGATIGLVRPDRLGAASPGYRERVEEFRGIYSALVEQHLPFDVLDQDLLAKMSREGTIDRFRLIVLPDLGPLGPDIAKAMNSFTAVGGNLLLTGSSAIDADGASELISGPAMVRNGRATVGNDLWSTYVTTSAQPGMPQYRYQGEMLPVFGSYSHFVWKPQAKRIGALLPQAPFGPPEKCYGHELSSEPAAVSLQGVGKVVHVPWTAGHTYREFGTTQIRDFITAQVEALAEVEVRGEMPEQVEMIVGRMPGAIVVHLINQTGARRKSFGPHVPVRGARLVVNGQGGTARALVSSTEFAGSPEAGSTVYDLPELGLYEVVVINVI